VISGVGDLSGALAADQIPVGEITAAILHPLTRGRRPGQRAAQWIGRHSADRCPSAKLRTVEGWCGGPTAPARLSAMCILTERV